MSFTVSHVSERWTGTKMVTSQRWKKLSPGWVQIYWRQRLVSEEYLICCFICFSSQGELKLAKKKLSMKEVDSVSDRAVSRNIIETKAYSCHKTICKAIEWHWKIDQLRRSRSTTWIRMGSWTTMSFSNLTQRNEIKAILGSVFNQPPNLDIRFNSSILFLEMFSVSKPLLRLPLVLMFNWSSYLSSLVDWFQNCQKYISRNCLITTQVRLVLCVWNDQIFYGGTQWCLAIIIFVKVAVQR